jgi:alpha-L-fucosidase 2
MLNITLPNLPMYQATAAQLVAFPVDANGYMIAKDCPLAVSHRHFSHMYGCVSGASRTVFTVSCRVVLWCRMSLWPLRTHNFSSPPEVELLETTIDHWLSLTGLLTGFSRPVGTGPDITMMVFCCV